MREATDKGSWTPFEKEYIHKDGYHIPILIGGSVIKNIGNEYIVFIIDLTERKNIDKKLKESEKRYRELYENSPLGYQSLNEEGRFIEVNPALCNLLGYEHDEIIGKWFGDILTKDCVEIFRTNFPKFKEKGEIHSVPFNLLTKNGDIISIELDGKIGYDKFGNFKQTHCTFQDVSTHKQLQHNLTTNLHYLTKAQEMGKMGTWELDFQTNISNWTDENYKTFDLPLVHRTG